MDRDCKEQGHDLEQVMTIAGYRCKSCKYYIRDSNILGTSWGRCPRCDAPRDKLEANFWGSERIEYKCKNCGHSWRQLR